MTPTESSHDRWAARCAREHAEAVARGEHDGKCEYLRTPGFHLCHCSKRRREAKGHATPPGELIFQPPICPRCDHEVDSDDDGGWICHRCCVYWDNHGTGAAFYDDYGDIDAESTSAEMTSSAPAVVNVHLPAISSALEGS